MLNRTKNHQPLNWYKTSLTNYYFRPEWELFDLFRDPRELNNIVNDKRNKVNIVYNSHKI